ncbi:MAG: hypothetical protein M1827_003371 [Pycnora praestabilis]|nr:MAG: hypothetical protein M1827_003371 [Pycnora praestabilis]
MSRVRAEPEVYDIKQIMRILEVQSPDIDTNSRPTSSSSLEPPIVSSPSFGWRFYAAFASLMVVNLICALDATSLSVALPSIADDLGGSAIQAFWSGTSFLLTSTVFQPSFASFSHIFGRQPMLLSAVTLFTVGAVVCGLARDFAIMLVGRSIQGVGSGGIVALTYIIVTDLVALRERGKWFGLISMTWAVGTITGPVLGGVFAVKLSWRWIFWINIPFCGIAFVTIPFFLKLHDKVGSLAGKLQQVDWVGSFVFVASSTTFLIPITWGGVMYPWTSWRTLVPLFVGVAGFLLFVLHSRYISDPLIRGSLFHSDTAVVGYYGTLIRGMVLTSIIYYLPLYFEACKGFSPIMSGVALFPMQFVLSPASVVAGITITLTGHYRWAIWSGWILTTLGVGLLTLLRSNTPIYEWIILNMVFALGMGINYPALSSSIQASNSNRDLPFAAAMFSFSEALGQALGVAVGGSVFQNRIKQQLLRIPELAHLANTYSRDASALVHIIKAMPASEAVTKTHIITAYVDALRVVWVVICALSGTALIASIVWTQGISLERPHETDQGFRHGLAKEVDKQVERELTTINVKEV